MDLKIKEPIEIEISGEKIKIKQYIPLSEKGLIVNLVVDNYFFVDEETGEAYKSLINKEATYVFSLIKHYTDTVFDEDAKLIDVYDSFVGSGVFHAIVSQIPYEEIRTIEDLIGQLIDEKEKELDRQNKIENIIKKFLNDIVKAIPDQKALMKMVKEMGKLNPEIINSVKEIVDKMNAGEIK
jgi:hypothetical protein